MSGEPLEMFGERPHRVGILSKMLVKQGHNVTWWTTTYDHQYKQYFYADDTETKSDFGVNMVFLHSKTQYKKNISLSRIKNHKEVAKKLSINAEKKDKPDIIFCAFPTIDLAYNAVKYANDNNVPIIIDVRDLWPNIFLDSFPKIFHPLIKLLLRNYFNQTKHIFHNATAITAVSEKYLQFGLNYAKRDKTKFDKTFPLAYNKIELSKEKATQLEQKFKKIGIDKTKKNIWFVGTFGKTYDLIPVIKTANDLVENDDVRFIFTGDGEMRDEWKKLSNKKNIIYTGWINENELAYIASVSSIGLMAYKSGAPQGLPNKVFEYMAYGLPIVSSLGNETKLLLEKENIGFTYDPDSIESLKKIIIHLINDEEKYETMSKRCTELYEKKYSAKKVYSELIDYLVSVKNQFKGK
jgi:glycosyltransferase involved in cell wall biosynthesis